MGAYIFWAVVLLIIKLNSILRTYFCRESCDNRSLVGSEERLWQTKKKKVKSVDYMCEVRSENDSSFSTA